MSDLEEKLVSAAANNYLNEVKKLLQEGADINGGSNWKPLGLAIYYGHTEIVEYLLQQGARTDIVTGDGKSPLALAKDHKHEHIISLIKQAEFFRTPEWSLFGSSKLARVEVSPLLNRKLTEIFNFESRDRMIVFENFENGTEKVLPLESFDALPEETLRKVFGKFTELGGKADEGMVFRRSILDKKQSPLKPE